MEVQLLRVFNLRHEIGSVVIFTPRPLYPEEITPNTHSIGGWMGPTVGLSALEKFYFPLFEPMTELLHQVNRPGSWSTLMLIYRAKKRDGLS